MCMQAAATAMSSEDEALPAPPSPSPLEGDASSASNPPASGGSNNLMLIIIIAAASVAVLVLLRLYNLRRWRLRARSMKVLDEIEMEFVNDDADIFVLEDDIDMPRSPSRCAAHRDTFRLLA